MHGHAIFRWSSQRSKEERAPRLFCSYFRDAFVAKERPNECFDKAAYVQRESGLTDGPTSARFAIVDYNADTGTLGPPAAETGDCVSRFRKVTSQKSVVRRPLQIPRATAILPVFQRRGKYGKGGSKYVVAVRSQASFLEEPIRKKYVCCIHVKVSICGGFDARKGLIFGAS
jgi:hypothetical protein